MVAAIVVACSAQLEHAQFDPHRQVKIMPKCNAASRGVELNSLVVKASSVGEGFGLLLLSQSQAPSGQSNFWGAWEGDENSGSEPVEAGRRGGGYGL